MAKRVGGTGGEAPVYTIEEAAEYLGMNQTTLNLYYTQGEDARLKPDMRMPDGTRLFWRSTLDKFKEKYVHGSQGLTIREIAQLYNVNPRTVRWWLTEKYATKVVGEKRGTMAFHPDDIEYIAAQAGWRKAA